MGFVMYWWLPRTNPFPTAIDSTSSNRVESDKALIWLVSRSVAIARWTHVPRTSMRLFQRPLPESSVSPTTSREYHVLWRCIEQRPLFSFYHLPETFLFIS